MTDIKGIGIRTLAALALTAAVASSCKEKKEDTNIIIPKTVKPERKATAVMADYKNTQTADWLGKTYSVTVRRRPDKTLPTARDEAGNDYYDNRISVTVCREDGSEFFSRTFTKDDFSRYLPQEVASDGALLGIVFDKVEDSKLRFAASVGSPDEMSDSFVPLVLTVSRMGDVSMSVSDSLEE